MSENLLVAAKSEYTEQLQEILCENIYNGIKTIWNSCKDIEKVNTLKCFQRKLCSIPEWNQEIINKIFKTIINAVDVTEDYIDKIIEAVFLSNVKILSVVKSSNKSQKINVSVPDTKHFIHRCYIESARAFYCDPFLLDDRERNGNTQVEIQRNVGRSINVIKLSIEKTIRNMIPMEEILKKYLENQEDDYRADYSDRKSEEELEPIDQEEDQPEHIEQEQDVDDIFNEAPRSQEELQHTPTQSYGPFMEQPTAESPFPRVPTPEPQAYYGPHVEPVIQEQQPQSSPLVVNLQQNHNEDNQDFFD
jgi:hypothetical protein